MHTNRNSFRLLLGCLLLGVVAGCQQPVTSSGSSTGSVINMVSGNAGTSGVAGSDAASAGIAGSGPSNTTGRGNELTFDVLTHSQGDRYAPHNVGAIWIETSSGTFVKTLETWYWVRGRHLTKFMSEAGGSQVDAVTGATLPSHTMHRTTWDLTDVNGQVVPDGAYQVLIEVADSNSGGQWTSVPFTKGVAGRVTPPDQAFYTAMTLTTP